jgi:hypothetical protein
MRVLAPPAAKPPDEIIGRLCAAMDLTQRVTLLAFRRVTNCMGLLNAASRGIFFAAAPITASKENDQAAGAEV